MTKSSYALHGQALLDHYRGVPDVVLTLEYKDRSILRLPMDVFFRESEDWPEAERVALSHCRGKILIVGAGAGVHALPLQQAGFEANVIDICPEAVEIMRSRGIINVSCENFFSHKGNYETILLLGNNVGIVEKLSKFPTLLQKCADLLEPCGRLIANSVDERLRSNTNPQHYRGEFEFRVRYKDKLGPWVGWLHIDDSVFSRMATDEGWNTELLFKSHEGDYAIMAQRT